MQIPLISLPVGLLVASIACSTVAPQVDVFGVSEGKRRASQADGQSVRLFLEVANPTDSTLTLSRLHYTLQANEWLSIQDDIVLERVVRAHGSVVIEVPVTLNHAARHTVGTRPGSAIGDGSFRYSLDGRLFAFSDRMERSWSVRADGKLGPDRVAGVAFDAPVRIRIAGSE